jgi:hypothetical protein
LIERFEGKWSIQENAGHLLDVEPLWAGRLDDVLACASELRSWDLTNRTTDEANYNSRTSFLWPSMTTITSPELQKFLSWHRKKHPLPNPTQPPRAVFLEEGQST